MPRGPPKAEVTSSNLVGRAKDCQAYTLVIFDLDGTLAGQRRAPAWRERVMTDKHVRTRPYTPKTILRFHS
jgi:hypothetical protein